MGEVSLSGTQQFLLRFFRLVDDRWRIVASGGQSHRLGVTETRPGATAAQPAHVNDTQ